MLERPDSGERTLLVHIRSGPGAWTDEENEFRELARSAGADIVGEISARVDRPEARLFIGQGKAEEIHQRVRQASVETVLFDADLSPSQERNLERAFQARVVDRAGLILDIFAQRARSFEGKLQVELAQLKHLSTRLVRGWTHLERQKGGIGLRGPGETQLETDRRLLAQRIRHLSRRLEKVRQDRGLGRRSRNRAEVPTVSMVGYTNAGKSTLFNRLTESSVYARDQLFATLDPTLRRMRLPESGAIVIADTVGFISRLPHELVAAFRSTLEETTEAALLLHVIDTADPNRAARSAEVRDIIEEIGAEDVPQIEIYNKIDCVEGVRPHVDRDEEGRISRIWLSARSGEGMDLLISVLDEHFRGQRVRRSLRLPPSAGRLRARLYEQGAILNESVTEEGDWLIDIEVGPVELARLESREDFRLVDVSPG